MQLATCARLLAKQGVLEGQSLVWIDLLRKSTAKPSRAFRRMPDPTGLTRCVMSMGTELIQRFRRWIGNLRAEARRLWAGDQEH